MSEATIKKDVKVGDGVVEVEARFSPGTITFFCGRRQGVAKWNRTRGEWVKVHNEVGWQMKAVLKAAFNL
jgi:hypothetical protein